MGRRAHQKGLGIAGLESDQSVHISHGGVVVTQAGVEEGAID
jgi:hypothetical protein